MNFAFRVHITKSIGLGHLKRLNILKKYIKQNVYWIVSGDKEIIYKNIRKSKNILFIKSIKHEAKIANELFAKGLNKVVFDIANNKFLKKNLNLKIISIYKNLGYKIISYDLPNQKNLSETQLEFFYLSSPLEIEKRLNSNDFKNFEPIKHSKIFYSLKDFILIEKKLSGLRNIDEKKIQKK